MIFEIFVYAVVVFLASSIIGILILYAYFKKQYKYWSKRNVPHATPEFPLGNLKLTKDETIFSLVKKLYDGSKHERYFGLWFLEKPALMINDLDLISKILIQNSKDFGSHDSYFAPEDDPIATNLFTLNGEGHKNLKANLIPMFNISKLQGMVPYMSKSSKAMQDVLQENARANDVVDVKDIVTRFVTDATYSALFGIDINFIKDPNSIVGKRTFEITESSLSTKLKFFIAIYIPGLARTLTIRLIDKELFKFFNKLFAGIIEKRMGNNVVRNDAMQLLTELVNKGYLDNLTGKTELCKRQKFTIEHLTVQGLTLLAGSHLNTSSRILWILYELALNPQVQQKLRAHIKSVLAQNNEEVTYEAVCQMDYLQQIMDEILRKYPSGAIITRACVNDFKDPDSSLIIEKGTFVIIPTAGLHWDEKYFPNPEKFDPGRFSQQKKILIPNCAYLPFGKGPRVCIAQKFGTLLVGTGLIGLLLKFRFDISEEYTPKQPKFDPKSIVLAPKDKMMLKISLLD